VTAVLLCSGALDIVARIVFGAVFLRSAAVRMSGAFNSSFGDAGAVGERSSELGSVSAESSVFTDENDQI
jgi:hypothetical protein